MEPALNSLGAMSPRDVYMRLILPRTHLPSSFPLKDILFSSWKPNVGRG